MKYYYLIYDALYDQAEPISEKDARNIIKTQNCTYQSQRKQTLREMGYELADGDIMVAVRLTDIGQLEKLLQESEQHDKRKPDK